MAIQVTLSDIEVAALENQFSGKTADEALHELLLTYVKKDSDIRLQALATQWRALTPDWQLEVSNLIKVWYADKLAKAAAAAAAAAASQQIP